MQLKLDSGVALVTGGSGGIGSAIVRRLIGCGLPVAFTYHRGREQAAALQSELACPDTLRAYPLSAPGFDEAATLVQQVEGDLGPVRYLVAAAGIAQQTAFHRLTEDEVRRIVDTNLGSAVAISRAVVTKMMKSGAGRIVLIGSVAGGRGLKGQTVYAATKAGLEGFTRALAREAGIFGVTVNCVAPGFIETRMTETVSRATRDGWLEAIPLARAGTPDEVAALVTFVLSEAASYLTGQTLVLDGGLSA